MFREVGSRAPGAGEPTSEEQAGRVLVLRVWPEAGGPRARLVSDERVVVAQGVQAICAEVERWLTGP